MADMQQPTTANGVSDPERGLIHASKPSDEERILPVPGVIFLLDLNGHIAAGYSLKEAEADRRDKRLSSQPPDLSDPVDRSPGRIVVDLNTNREP